MWYVVPQLILLGNLFFPILVYGYFVTASDAHAAGAARLLAEMAALVLAAVLAAQRLLLPLLLESCRLGEPGRALLGAGAAWVACWLGLLGLASRYTSCPHPLDSCASARLWQRVERQRGEPLAEGALVTVEQEAAALLELNDDDDTGRAT